MKWPGKEGLLGIEVCGSTNWQTRFKIYDLEIFPGFILDMLNLMASGLFPRHFIDTYATNLASSWGQWTHCVTQYIVDSK